MNATPTPHPDEAERLASDPFVGFTPQHLEPSAICAKLNAQAVVIVMVRDEDNMTAVATIGSMSDGKPLTTYGLAAVLDMASRALERNEPRFVTFEKPQ